MAIDNNDDPAGDENRRTVFSKNQLTSFASKNVWRFKQRAPELNIFLFGLQAAIVLLIIGVIIFSYRAPSKTVNQSIPTSVLNPATLNVDQVVEASVATSIAQVAGMPTDIYDSVSSLSISLNAKTEMDQTDNDRLNKPQLINQTGRDNVTQYSVQNGDTVQSIAAKFHISDDTVRWASNLTSDTLKAGQNLTILGTTGVLYTVKAGDSVQALADKYKSDPSRIIAFNNLELTGLNAGQKIIIPDGILPTNERPGYVAPRSSYYAFSSAPRVGAYSGNGYAYGYCTYYAYNRRAAIGRPIGGNWGNAATWAYYARQDGYRVDHSPEVGAVMQTEGGWGGYTYFGHVGVVENVNGDGTIRVSEMNATGGWNVVDYRTIPANEVGLYNYIH